MPYSSLGALIILQLSSSEIGKRLMNHALWIGLCYEFSNQG